MSNKKNARASLKWTQIGNFLLCHEKNSFGEVLCVKAVSGQWSIRWSDDTMLYAVLSRLMDDKKCHSYVEALLCLFFAATNYAHDFMALAETQQTPFIDGFSKLMNEQTEREVALKGEASQEEDDAALKEVGELQEIMDELERLDAVNDGKEGN